MIRVLILLLCILILNGCSRAAVIMDSETETYERIETYNLESAFVTVYICGCVNNPGVYELETGSRIIDAVKMAGGLTEDAFQGSINLAEILSDGEMISFPSIEESADIIDDGLININKANETELMTLPGIGKAKANDILEYIETHGPFKSIEELMNVPGIKSGTYDNIKELIKV